MFIKDLYDLIKSRKNTLPKDSYTTSLFKGGVDRIIQKVGEEAVEVVIAAKNRSRERQISELADLWYHIFVLMVEKGILIEDVEQTLKERHQVARMKK